MSSNATRILLILLFVGILVAMVTITVQASLDRSILEAGPLLDDSWFRATLADAYFGFLTFYCWVAYREIGLHRKLIWFVLIMALGNIAMAVYMLIALWRWQPSGGVGALLIRQ